ncbi:MAG: 3-oxoacyl-[acyl-carrier-protein] reductase [Spirochaetota bacterium]
MDLTEKVCVVTGGARGIGREIASVFARNGADIAVCDINQEVLDQAVSDLKNYNTHAEGYLADVSDYNDAEQMIKKAIDNFGRIDILVNNAGITRDNLLIRMSEEDFDKVISINLKGAFNCTKAVARSMMKRRSGRIINIASVVGLTGNAGQINYASSKAGLVGMTKSAAKELASRNITVNAVAPGFIETEMTRKLPEDARIRMLESVPMKRPGKPHDVANAVLFFASAYSSYITGQVLIVDGGMVM